MDPGRLQVPVSDARQLFVASIANRRHVPGAAEDLALAQPREIRQFRCRFDSSVTREDLLDERRARTWNTDRKNGYNITFVAPRDTGHGLGVETGNDGVDYTLMLVAIPLHDLAPAFVATGVVNPCIVVLFTIIHGFAKREIEISSISIGERGGFSQCLHTLDIIVTELVRAQTRQAPPGLALADVLINEFARPLDDFLGPTQPSEGIETAQLTSR